MNVFVSRFSELEVEVNDYKKVPGCLYEEEKDVEQKIYPPMEVFDQYFILDCDFKNVKFNPRKAIPSVVEASWAKLEESAPVTI